jgi:hypothetical protein
MPASRARNTPIGPVSLFAAALALLALAVSPGAARAQTASVTLLWTAPGDDGMTGRASRYDLRISTSPVAGTDTLSWWNAATVVDMSGRVPAPAGAADSVAVSNLTAGTQYYAILRAGDEVPNWSGFSNVAVIDLRDSIPPSPVTNLRIRF